MKSLSKLTRHLTLITFFVVVCTLCHAQIYYLYIGTYTQKTSQGIYVYEFNTKSGDFKPVSITKGNTNPSFLAISTNERFLYSLAGKKGDSVKAYSIEKPSHYLRLLNAQSLGESSGACYLTVDQTGKWLIVANYGSGSVTELQLQPNGMLGNVSQTIKHEGKGIDPERQQKPYVHSINIAPNNKDVFVPDLGTDKIMTYSLDVETGKLAPGNIPYTSVAPGSGPRHFTFHPNGKFAYVINEMTASITGFRYKAGSLETIETVKNLPDSYTGRKWAADIHISPDGKFLYGSNRAHDSLVIFSIDQQSGKLTLVGIESTHGKTPRNFTIDPKGNFLLVANQDSDNITIFKRDKKTGKLTMMENEITISMPVCLKFIQ